MSFSVGQIVTGGCQFSIGRKDSPVHISKQGYNAMLKSIDQRYFVLWDECDKLGWLVNGASTLLHLLRSSLEDYKVDGFRDELLFNAEDFEEPSVRFRTDSAFLALKNSSNRKLRLYKLKEDVVEEEVEWTGGRREIVTKTRTSYTTIEDRTVELFETLEKLIDYEAQSEASAKGVNIKPRLHSQVLGWDFRDVVTNRDPLYLRVTTLPSCGGAWVDFAKSIRAVTLFGCGFGDLIKTDARTQNGPWHTVPTGTGSLVACMADLRKIIDKEGDRTTQPLTLSRGITWYNPSQRSPFEARSSSSSKGWNPIQELLPAGSPFQSLLSYVKSSGEVDIDNCKHGAVIFGRSKLPRLWADVEDRTTSELPLSETPQNWSKEKTLLSQRVKEMDDISDSSGNIVSQSESTVGSSSKRTPNRFSPRLGSDSGSGSSSGSGTQPTTVEPLTQSSSQAETKGSVSEGSGRGVGPGRRRRMKELQRKMRGILERSKIASLTSDLFCIHRKRH